MLPAGPVLRYWEFRAPRQGHALEDCQDASAGNPLAGRFAIADGASESYSPGLWARLLVQTFVRSEHFAASADSWLPAPRKQWYNEVQKKDSAQLPYYLEEQFRLGAFATFLGLTIDVVPTSDQPRRPPYRWQAFAVGDSCLFQVRADQLLETFPVQCSEELDGSPWLIGSRASPMIFSPQACHEGIVSSSDRVWLMTDALALWFLREVEQGRKPWQQLNDLLHARLPSQAFTAWIDDLRHRRLLRDDDVTLLAIYPEGVEPG